MKKTLLLKVEKEKYEQFSKWCEENGYTKTGWINYQITQLLKKVGK